MVEGYVACVCGMTM